MAHNARISTGPGRHAVPLPILGVDVNPASWQARLSPDFKAMKQEGTNMALASRSPGLRTTQLEFQKFLGNAPDPYDFGEANAGPVENAENLKIGTGAKQAFYESWIRNHPNLSGAHDAWMGYVATRLPQFYQGAARRAPPGGTPQAAPSAPTPLAQAAASAPTSGPSANDVQYLQANPSKAVQFDSRFGRGAAARILKGG
jgi:hypothetical protein